MGRELLKDIYYGDELHKVDGLMRWAKTMLPQLEEEPSHHRILREVKAFFSVRRAGVFGGPITAGDATVLAAMMEWIKPSHMVEIGVASGVSSAFILNYARSAELTSEDEKFLYSIDIADTNRDGARIGSFVDLHFPELLPNWTLKTEATSASLLADDEFLPKEFNGPVLGFIDGGHEHPWPLLDITYLYRTLPRGSWVVLQDVQMMERWIADCVIYGVACPAPQRGVHYVVSHWPGTKILGFDSAYNSAAIQLNISEAEFSSFLSTALAYPREIVFPYDELFKPFLRWAVGFHAEVSRFFHREVSHL